VVKDVYDFRLTIDGKEYGFLLAENEGVKQWNDGLAPFITPQFRTGAFGYEHTPPEIEVPIAAEDWSGGAGYDLSATGGSVSSNIYNYSRGVDLSYENRVFLSPALQDIPQSDLTAIDFPPTKFLYNSYGLHMIAGYHIYKYETSSDTWVMVNDGSAAALPVSTGGTQYYTDIVEHNGILFAARSSPESSDDAVSYRYSIDGLTWIQASLAASLFGNIYADYFTVKGNSSSVSNLWKTRGNLILNNPDGTDYGSFGSSSWSGTDEIGHTSETPTGLVTVNNDIWMFKKEGIYVYDGVAGQDIWTTKYVKDTNGRNPFLWIDNYIYVVYGDRLLQLNPFNSDLLPVYPNPAQDSLETKGEITAVGGDSQFLYIAVKNTEGNTYILKGRPNGGWHTLTYLGANDCNALVLVPPGVVHDDNPALVIGYGTGSGYYILPRNQSKPDEDDNCVFEDSGFVVGSYINFGAKSFNKFLNRASLLGDGISAGRSVTLKYETDRSGTEVTLVEATSSGITEADETDDVQFNQIRYILHMATGDDVITPAVDSLALYATLNPRRKHIWRPVVALSDSLQLASGADANTSQPSATKLKEMLFGAVTKRITLQDDQHHTYTVRLLDINSTGKIAKQIGGKRHDATGYQMTLVEIRAINTNQTVAVYGEHSYGQGAVFG
jgi:hypothetical protein